MRLRCTPAFADVSSFLPKHCPFATRSDAAECNGTKKGSARTRHFLMVRFFWKSVQTKIGLFHQPTLMKGELGMRVFYRLGDVEAFERGGRHEPQAKAA